MSIISKRRIILSCLIILKILRTIIEGAHAVVVYVYQKLEVSLKKEESTKRTAADSFNNSGSSTTSLQASESVDRNLSTTDFVTSYFYPLRNVPVKFINRNSVKASASVASPIYTSEVQKTSVPVEGKSYPSELDSSDPFPVYTTLDQVRPTQNPVDSFLVLAIAALDQKTSPGKNISFDSIPKHTLNSQVSTPTQSSEDVNITAESSDDKVSRSDPKYILKLNEDNLNNEVSENATSNITKPVLTETVPKYLDVVTTYQTNVTHKRRKIDESEQVEIGIKQGDNTDRSTVNSSPIAAACTKDDIKCTKDDIKCTKTVVQDKVHMSDTNENLQPKNIINSDQEHTNDANVTSHDIGNQATPVENQQIESTENVPTVTYEDFLKEIIPTIYEIESIILGLAEVRYTRSTLDEEDFLIADFELNQIMNESSKVNLPAGWAPNIGLKYLFEIQNILVNLNNDLDTSMNPRNRTKVSSFMEKLAVRLQDARKILYDVDKKGIKIKMRMKKLTSIVKNMTKVF